MAKFTDLPVITASTITDNHVFAVATSTTTDQLTLGQLQKSLTGLQARSSSISIIGNATPSGITVGTNGYVGIDNFSPVVALDIGDIGTNGNGKVRISAASPSRQVSFNLKDSNIDWEIVKKASDTDLYIQASGSGASTVTGFLNIDAKGNVGILTGQRDLPAKFYVSGGNVMFESGLATIEFTFDSFGFAEMRSNNTTNDIFYINKTDNQDVVLGNDVLYVDNNTTVPFVGINNTAPAYPLDIGGSGVFMRFKNGTSANTSAILSNTSRSGYYGLYTNNFNIGPSNFNSSNNLVYALNSKNLGLGTVSPNTKLHVLGSGNACAKFEIDDSNLNKVTQVNNYASGPASGPIHVVYNFARATTGPVLNVDKWGIGLYYSSGNYNDSFVFRVNADTTSDSAIKASLDANGNFDIKGSMTTSGDYTKGKFIQCYKTRLTGNCVYFDPLSDNCSTTASGHNYAFAPFSVMPYSGSVEKIQIMSSNTGTLLSNISTFTGRFEIVAITQSANTPANFTGVTSLTTSPPTAGLVSGVVGYHNFSTLTRNSVYTFTKSQLTAGNANFSPNQLLQYRICRGDGTTTTGDFTITSSLSYTIT